MNDKECDKCGEAKQGHGKKEDGHRFVYKLVPLNERGSSTEEYKAACASDSKWIASK